MKTIYLIIISAILLASCESRKCECIDDITFNWNEDVKPDSIFIVVPNAVLNNGHPLAIKLLLFEEVEVWKLKSAKIHKDGQMFVDTADLDMFVKNSEIIEFPHDIFSSASEEVIKGPVNVEIEIQFPQREATFLIDGTIYYYSCEDLDDEFNPEECRWPRQVTGTSSSNPC